MIINVYNEQEAQAISPAQVEKLVVQVLQEEQCVCHEVNIHFVSVKEISDLHQEYFDDPTPTDCISFPMDDDPNEGIDYRILGDVFVCPETAIQYSKEHQTDPYEETTLYVIHGLLHLLGYDDIDEDEEVLMRDAERRLMGVAKRNDLILSHVNAP